MLKYKWNIYISLTKLHKHLKWMKDRAAAEIQRIVSCCNNVSANCCSRCGYKNKGYGSVHASVFFWAPKRPGPIFFFCPKQDPLNMSKGRYYLEVSESLNAPKIIY